MLPPRLEIDFRIWRSKFARIANVDILTRLTNAYIHLDVLDAFEEDEKGKVLLSALFGLYILYEAHSINTRELVERINIPEDALIELYSPLIEERVIELSDGTFTLLQSARSAQFIQAFNWRCTAVGIR